MGGVLCMWWSRVLFSSIWLLRMRYHPTVRCVWCAYCALWVLCGHAFHVCKDMHRGYRLWVVGFVFAVYGRGDVDNAHPGCVSGESPQCLHSSFFLHTDPVQLFGCFPTSSVGVAAPWRRRWVVGACALVWDVVLPQGLWLRVHGVVSWYLLWRGFL